MSGISHIVTNLLGLYAATYLLDSLSETKRGLKIIKENKKRNLVACFLIDKVPETIKITSNTSSQTIFYPKELEEIILKFQNHVDEETFNTCQIKLQNLHINYFSLINDLKQYLQNFTYKEGSYSPDSNTIDIYKIFGKTSVLSHEFLHLASSNGLSSGFCTLLDDVWFGNGLDEGYTEFLNKKIFNAKHTSYKHNIEIIELLELFFDNPKDFENAYFNNDIFTVYHTFIKYGTKEEFFKLLQNLDNLIETDIPFYQNIIKIKTKAELFEIIQRSNDPNKINKFKDKLNKDYMFKILKKSKKKTP